MGNTGRLNNTNSTGNTGDTGNTGSNFPASVLPSELLELLNGRSLEEKQGEAMILMTVSEDGWPHTAMLSVGEVTAADPQTLRIGLWPGTETSRNLARTGKAQLIAVYQGKVSYMKLAVRPLSPLKESEHPRDRYEAELTGIKQDAAKYAEIVSGIRFKLLDPPGVIRRWEQTVEDLLRDS